MNASYINFHEHTISSNGKNETRRKTRKQNINPNNENLKLMEKVDQFAAGHEYTALTQ